jgi:hypothetical protein
VSSEALYVPEENLADVIAVIRAGLKVARVDIGTQLSLEEWCAEEEAYLKAMDDDFEDDDDG